MTTRLRRTAGIAGVLAAMLALAAPRALAVGTETLGPPLVPVASGTGILAAGVGTELSQPASFTFSVPGSVRQVLLYWLGHFSQTLGGSGDNTIAVNGIPIQGTSIGGPTLFFTSGEHDFRFQAYAADITGLGLVAPGSNTLTVSGLDFVSGRGGNDGAGVIVVFDDGSPSATIGIRDGLDLAFFGFAPPLDTTVPQTFTFPAAPIERTATLATLAGSVAGPASGFGPVRPNRLRITLDVGGTFDIINPWASFQGPEFDAANFSIPIPAGATQLTVQALSADDGSGNLPASFAWIGAGLSVPPPPPAPGVGTPGFWKNHPEAWPVSSVTIGGLVFSRSQAIGLLGQPPKGDVTYILARALIAAKLNVAAGNPADCIATTIAAADAWLAVRPPGSKVSGGSAAWKQGEPLAKRLDDYNNGLLCAPARK